MADLPLGGARGIGGFIKDWGPTIGSIAGTAVDAWSQNQSNKANAANVDKQIAFQKQQSETQYQRAVADMQKAGLNPALAYQQGGNAAESGAAARAEPILQNSTSRLATAVDTYNALAGGVAQRELLKGQANAANAAAGLAGAQTVVLNPEAQVAEDVDYRRGYRERRIAEQAAGTFTARKTPDRFKADLANLGAGTAQAQAAAAEAGSRTILNEQLFQNEWFRKNLAPYINSTAKTVDLFRGVVNLTPRR